MLKTLHYFHDEEKAKWEFIRLDETDVAYIGVWNVHCSCGAVKCRQRAFPKPDDLSLSFASRHSIEQDGPTLYYALCGHSSESAAAAAQTYKGDNYHV